jgi:hypothetical protein
MEERDTQRIRYSSEGLSEPELTVEHTDALLCETVERLSRHYPPHLVGLAACEELQTLRPHVLKSLEALADIERRRDLTDKEQALRGAFRILLEP